MNPSTAQARVVVDELIRGGVRHAVIAPGSRSAPLALALHARSEIALHVEIDERSAAFLAAGIAKVSGEPTVVACTSGTAAVNFHPAVVEAFHSRTPLLVLTADRPPELRDTGANQAIDQIGLYGTTVRWSAELAVAERRPGAVAYWRSVVARAVAEAVGRPAGPVHLNVPLRDPLAPDDDPSWIEPLDGRDEGLPWTSRSADLALPSATTVADVARFVTAYERGALVLGDVAVEGAAVAGFAAVAAWPVVADPHSNARTGDHVISTADLLLASDAFATAHVPDVVMIIGRPVLARSLRRWLDAVPHAVLIDADGAWLDPGRRINHILRADPTALLRDVAAGMDAAGPTHWIAQWQHAERRARSAVDTLLDATPTPTEPRIARDLAACLPDGALLAVASSMPIRDLASVMRPRGGLRVLGNRGASGIDGFVSTVLGAAIVHDGPVVALAGDLSVLHDQNGLLLAGRDALDAVFVVINNDGGGIFSLLEYRDLPGFDRLFGTPHRVDFASLAATYGLGYQPLARASDLADVVAAAVAKGGIQLVEARTDRTENADLHERLRAAVTAAIERDGDRGQR
jgi:2-succinyl-5-enolpyruvyl-6-hydroxy-3-cyclohexene-1-carboxylate synthase